jgi:hypothetical protein
MRTRKHRLFLLIAVAFAVAAAVPAAQAADGRSPETKDAAVATRESRTTLDLGSPDTRDAALRAEVLRSARADVRAPDTKDAALLADSPPRSSPVTPVTGIGGNGFEWTDAGIGAAAGFAVALLLAGAYVVARRGRGQERVASSM